MVTSLFGVFNICDEFKINSEVSGSDELSFISEELDGFGLPHIMLENEGNLVLVDSVKILLVL